MALIGTISGSIGAGGALTSTTAISGTLVIADSPASVFPMLPADVKFFVSGVQGAIASSLPGVAVFGGDLRVSGSSYFTDIDVTGHGAVVVQPYGTSAGQTGEVRFKELAANGGNYTALKAADSIAANLSITLPNAAGSNGNVLQTNGSGVTSFVDVNGLVTGSLSLVTINASSNITASNILANGDLAVNGGDITTSAGTFNLVNATATTVNLGGGASAVNIGAAGSATTFAGNLTGSNALLSGDLAVNGGDITSTSSTFNLVTGSVATLNIGGSATAITIGSGSSNSVMTLNGVITASSGKIALTNAAGSLISFPVGGGALGAPTFTNSSIGTRLLLYPSIGASSADWAIGMENQAMWFGINVATTTPRFKWYAGTTEIASLRGDGLFTVTGSLATSTGNIIGAPGSGANVMTLISSGNLLAKIDANNDGTGHKFAVLDYRDIEQFTVFEEGNAALSGSLVVSGSSIQTVTTTTYNLLTTALTGTLNVGTLANAIVVGGTVTTSSFTGAMQVDGRTTLSSVTEKLVPSVGGTGTVAYDLAGASIFYVNGPTGAITANFTNVPTTPNRIITPTVIISQSATPRIVSGVQIDTVAQTINWANGTTPTGTANKQDVFGFSLIRSGSTWKVLGQMSTYG
ncbi:MAG: hypothetical protein EBU08_01555 [Micrococcales bacterium]|nr:hypothetical protein [Micrococcales bacterium]